jgi:hypothetical protein
VAPVLHQVLNYEPLKPHIWGGKGVGSQGDGTAQFMPAARRINWRLSRSDMRPGLASPRTDAASE